MIFDTKSISRMAAIAAFVLTTAPLANAQNLFPFSVARDSSGAITRIEIPVREAMLDEENDLLSELRVSVKDFQESNAVGFTALSADAIAPNNEDDKKLFVQAKAFLKNDLSTATLNDPRLDTEFASAKSQILSIKLYRLLAAPNAVGAFDTERAVTELIQKILGKAGGHIGGPVFGIFQFLVGEYIGSLDSRRSFYQNQLLSLLATDTTLFTESEKSAIRSSIYYSRLDFKNVLKRVSARRNWTSYGDEQLSDTLKPCQGFVLAGENGFGNCFKQSGDIYVNRLNRKSNISRSVSLAFDSKNPYRVRDLRILLMLSKFGLNMLPAPSFVKSRLNSWITSQYEDQRKSEGFFYGYAEMKNQSVLGDWVLTNTANPLIRK